jgi:hypothetical protein
MCFKETGFEIDRSHKFPDYIISNGCNRVAVEVTTATGGLPVDSKYVTHENNPTLVQDVNSEQYKHYSKNDVPLAFSSAILSKLQMKYWEKEHCKDIPFVIFIGGFFADNASLFSCAPLTSILFGIGDLYHVLGFPFAKYIDSHDKRGTKIPSGLFYMPTDEWKDMCHVSAIAFSNAGSTSKFNRMGWARGYYKSWNPVMRSGLMLNRNGPDPIRFVYMLDDPPFIEQWKDEVNVIHNPNAERPLPLSVFEGFTQTYVKDGILETSVPKGRSHVFVSETITHATEDIEFTHPYVERITKAEFTSHFRSFVKRSRDITEIYWFKNPKNGKIGVIYLKGKSRSFNYYAFRIFCFTNENHRYSKYIRSRKYKRELDAINGMIDAITG